MKEAIGVIDLANEYIIKVEDQWVTEEMNNVDTLHRRAKGSHTLVAQKEFESAKERLSHELERIGVIFPNPNED